MSSPNHFGPPDPPITEDRGEQGEAGMPGWLDWPEAVNSLQNQVDELEKLVDKVKNELETYPDLVQFTEVVESVKTLSVVNKALNQRLDIHEARLGQLAKGQYETRAEQDMADEVYGEPPDERFEVYASPLYSTRQWLEGGRPNEHRYLVRQRLKHRHDEAPWTSYAAVARLDGWLPGYYMVADGGFPKDAIERYDEADYLRVQYRPDILAALGGAGCEQSVPDA